MSSKNPKFEGPKNNKTPVKQSNKSNLMKQINFETTKAEKASRFTPKSGSKKKKLINKCFM